MWEQDNNAWVKKKGKINVLWTSQGEWVEQLKMDEN